MFIIFSWNWPWWRRKFIRSVFFEVLVILAVSLALAQKTSPNQIGLRKSNITEVLDSEEYYYYDEDESAEFLKSKNGTKPLLADEYYYTYEEVLMLPKNSSKVIKLNKLGGKKTWDEVRKGRKKKEEEKQDSIKSESGHLVVLPSPSPGPLKEIATPVDIVGPTYTDRNYGKSWEVAKASEEKPWGEPLGASDFLGGPSLSFYANNQEYAQGQDETFNPESMRPPPPDPTQETDEDLNFSVVKHVNAFNDIVKDLPDDDKNENSAIVHENGVLHHLYFDKDKKNPAKKPQIHTQLSIGAYGWSTVSKKNPIVKIKEFLYHLAYIMTHLSESDTIFYTEKLVNILSEMKVPAQYYLRMISVVGIYLYVMVMIYRSEDLTELKCTVDNNNMPLRRWKYHASRRFVPVRASDHRLQRKFLKLFRGVDEEDEEFSDLNNLSRSAGEYEDELDFISDMCPRDHFFYSMNPRHVEAYMTLQKIFLSQETPEDVLSLAKCLLHSEKVHPKVWYFAVTATWFVRQDMTGLSIAHPLDAIPDWYIPAHLIEDLVKSYRKIRIKRSTPSELGFETNQTIPSQSSASTSAELKFETSPNYHAELPQFSLPVHSDNGSYTVTFVASSKEINDNGTDVIEVISSSEVHSQEEYSEILPLGKLEDLMKSELNEVDLKHVSSLNFRAKGETGDLPVRVKKIGKNKEKEEDDHRNRRHRHKKKGKKKKKKGRCIKVNWKSGLDNGIENKLFYFREDMMVNQHHWYWHRFHAQNATHHADRRGELFFYMHRSLVARYNAERLSNGFPTASTLRFRPGGIIYEGYHSHLADISSGIYWTARWPHTPITDILHNDDPDFRQNITMTSFATICQRILKAIKSGKILTKDGLRLPIDHTRGIDPLSNTIEASDISVNPMYYNANGIHSMGHVVLGLAADPYYHFKKPPGVMAAPEVAMRDPVFYTYHTFIDNIFEAHKETLPPYQVIKGEFPLLWKGVEVVKIQVQSQGETPVNELRTFWTVRKFDLSPGVDRTFEKGKKNSKICAQHLDHEPFFFKIIIDRKPCVRSKSNMGTVRIFMAPRYDHKGRRIPMKVQRRLMFTLDVFSVKLKVGRNTITRYAEDSALTQPWTKSLRDLERGPDSSGAAEFCGCGWPQHMYIPKGHEKGMPFDLFVMVTNYDEDYVPNDPKVLEIPETCNSPYIFCGIPRRKYPDKRPMGYPFDRPLFKSFNCPPGWTFSSVICKLANLLLHNPIDTLEEYVSKAPNMGMLKVHIRHLNSYFPEPARHR